METAVNEMIIKIADKTEIEHLISIFNLGLCVAIENGVLNIEEIKTSTLEFLKSRKAPISIASRRKWIQK